MNYNTIDSQPQESLLNNPNLIHTFCFCVFKDKRILFDWIKKLVPHDKNGVPKKWSNGDGKVRSLNNRKEFIENLEKNKNDLDFKVYCISSNESQISIFANAFYLSNIGNIVQENDSKGRNCLVFRITDAKTLKIPALRAANLIWIYYCLKYLCEEKGINGFIYSDWFSNDSMQGDDKAVGVAIVNYFLKTSNLGIQISIAKPNTTRYDDIISDWFAGWTNSSRNRKVDQEIIDSFEKFLVDKPDVIEWIEYCCNYT